MVTEKIGLSRRELLSSTAAIGMAASFPSAAQDAEHTADPDQPHRAAKPNLAAPGSGRTYIFFSQEEASFVEAAVARLIPTDASRPGAIEADVPTYLDRQLAGAWGAGERLYRSGPWTRGTPSQGYQLPFTPAELFRTAAGGLTRLVAAEAGRSFADLAPDQQDAWLRRLEKGEFELNGVPSDLFFALLWGGTVEGFFSDPVYGGNRDMVAWRMIGFPGAYASYYDLVDQHGIAIDRAPLGLAAGRGEHSHRSPNPPSREKSETEEGSAWPKN